MSLAKRWEGANMTGVQTPYRKPGKFSQMKNDPLLTKGKFEELKNKLEKLKNSRPKQAEEVARLAELGDFSENVAYQYAKGRLRGINQSILNLEKQLQEAEIINPEKQTNSVQIGHKVTVLSDGKQKTYEILGSSETDPQKGVISYNSPIGAALIGRKVGEVVTIKLANKEVGYKIIEIK